MPPRSLPLSPAALQDQLVRQVLLVSSLVSMVLALSFALMFLRQGQMPLTWLECGTAVALAVNLLISRRFNRPLLGLQSLFVILWLLLACMVYLRGGLRAPTVSWIVLLPPLVMMVSRRLALTLTGATIALLFAAYFAEQLAWLPPHLDAPPMQRLVASCIASVLFVLFAWFAMRWREMLAEALGRARDDAIESNALKDRFIANLNHEIRTPLNALAAGVHLMRQQSRDPEQIALANTLQQSAQHLLALVNDVLDHARLAAGEMPVNPQPFSLRQLTRNAIDMFSAQATRKSIALRLELPDPIDDVWVGDATRLLQILSNLLSNALKFTPEGGAVTLQVRAGSPHTLEFAVQDTGPGISPEVQSRLFRPYEQGDSSITRRFGGSGLGLCICKELVGLMHGRIEVHSQLGEGSRFVVHMPLAPSHPQALRHLAPEPPISLDHLRVLLVEDDAVNRVVMQAVLGALGPQVQSAENGLRALALLESGHFDIVLLDCQMPELDGLTVARRWREREAQLKGARTPLIALTGEALPGTRQACLDAGMDDYLVKPIATDALRTTLLRWTSASAPTAH